MSKFHPAPQQKPTRLDHALMSLPHGDVSLVLYSSGDQPWQLTVYPKSAFGDADNSATAQKILIPKMVETLTALAGELQAYYNGME